MANILEQIVADKRLVIEAMKQSFPLDKFIDDLTPSTKCMYSALAEENAGFILECKKASPSKGLIRADFDVKAISTIYNKYAAAISVLTEQKYFQGELDYLKIVSENVSCPVLNKDFFFDTYQVHLARYYGADAILLMLSVLSDDEYNELAAVAKSYDLSILTEISTHEEMERAIALDAKLIGINNRNLRDLSTDIMRTFEFTPHIPEDRLVISESGIYSNEQVRMLAPAVNGFLVGSSVMSEADIDLACRKLIYGNHKVCGLTKPEYAQAAINSGAVFGGLIFAEKSPRYVTESQALDIVTNSPSLNYVGVFVNHGIIEVAKLASDLNLYAVQLHGNEDAFYVEQLVQVLPENCQIWQAYPVIDEVPTLSKKVAHHVLDGKRAGSGQVFDWRLLARSEQDLSSAFLAGGLSIDNISNAIEQLTQRPLYGVDLNSGVESSPGIKSEDKLNQVFAKLRCY
ncbi:MAG: bifunctional indole-3-glycerol-phosphate synthase TrpC/phosphoribosylanthranilate isomerase TrpF [Thalassotalea sp.]